MATSVNDGRATAHGLDFDGFTGVASLLGDEERDIQLSVRSFAAKRLVPHIDDWWEAGVFPLELAREPGELGLLGMHLEGYGCAGASATSYGLACMELEAVDSGLRSFVSVQGSLAMFPIWRATAQTSSVRAGCPTWRPAA
jgi:glutaryl-CoA dehydrogenase